MTTNRITSLDTKPLDEIPALMPNAGPVDERMCAVAREAQIHNEKPMAQWFSPSGCGIRPKPFALLFNRNVQITTIKQAENGEGWIIRLFEPTGRRQKTRLRILAGKPIRKTVTLWADFGLSRRLGPLITWRG